MSFAETDRIAQLIPAPRQGFDYPIAEALKMEPRLKEYADGEGRELITLAMKLEGLTRHSSTHAAGVVIGDRPLVELLPMMVDKDGTNFINGELWGRAADPSLPWAMVFPQSGSNVPRHPSQIYQFLLEGLLLFALLWLYARRPAAYRGVHGQPVWGKVSGAFLFGYGALRFAAEYFREPDSFLGLLALNLSMGQWLSLPMAAAGIAMWVWASRRPAVTPS